MQHCDPDVLALRALGEHAGTDADEAHLAECEQCRHELVQLRSVVTTGRQIAAEDQPQPPPVHVWAAVSAELGFSGPARPEIPALPARRAVRLGSVISLRRRAAVLVAAAVAGLGVGVAGTLAVLNAASEPAPAVIAQADLAPLPGWTAQGTAQIIESEGRRILHVTLADGQVPTGYREVWLLDAGAQRLVSLGVLAGDEGEFPLPDGLDLGEFPVVDVSQEPYDGDPAHSGDSLVRGQLDV